MSQELADLLDLKTAWTRVKDDIVRKRTFVRHPYELAVVESNLDEWLDSVRNLVASDRYYPSPAYACDVPKPKGAVRPGALLSLADRLVYAACVGACLPAIHGYIGWSQGVADFAYRLAKTPTDPKWVQNRFQGWDDFRATSLSTAEKFPFVIMSDISAFYENIDLGLLNSDLRKLNAPAPAIAQLNACLNRWTQNGRGIPQGQTASDILAKVYLNDIDENLITTGHAHCRYVDDTRIFCLSEAKAREALVAFARLLRAKGLNLQSAKSSILTSEAAIEEIEGVTPLIRQIARKYVGEVARTLGGDPYMSVSEADGLIAADADDAPLEVLQEAYVMYLINDAGRFNPSLFHFLLKRLGRYGDDFAVTHCLELMRQRPEETEAIFDYFDSIHCYKKVEEPVREFLDSEMAVYPYQNYQILEWVASQNDPPSWEMLGTGRRLALDRSQPRFLRAISRKLIGDHGTQADLELLLQSYQEVTDPMEQLEVMCSLRRLELGRRNGFLSRAENDGLLNKFAAIFVRASGH